MASMTLTTAHTDQGPAKPCAHLPDGGCKRLIRCLMLNISAREGFKLPKNPSAEERHNGGCYDPDYLYRTLHAGFFAMGGVLPEHNEMHVYMHLMNETGTKELLRLNFEGFASDHAPTRFYLQIIPMEVGRYPECLKKWVAAWWLGRGREVTGAFTDYNLPYNTPVKTTEQMWQLHVPSLRYLQERRRFDALQGNRARVEDAKRAEAAWCALMVPASDKTQEGTGA